MMNKIEEYCTLKEGQHFDRKESKIENKKILPHIVGFANAEGGTLVIGISDNGKITGCKNSNRDDKDIERLINNSIYPTPNIEVNSITIEDDYIIEIKVQPVTDAVVKIRDSEKVYLRQSDSTDELKYERIKQLEFEKGQRSYEDELEERFDVNDFDLSLFDEYRQQMQTQQSNEEILNVRTASFDGNYSKASILMFAKNPCKYLPNARVRFIRYDGTKSETGSRLNIIKERNFELPLPRLVEEVKKMLKEQLRDFTNLSEDGRFVTVPEYPEFAWLEGIVNAVVHRDYSITGDCIKIIMYDDRLEIFSPGRLPSIVTIENLKFTRFSRNPRIARLMSDFGYVKELNEGVKRIYEEMNEFFLDEPEYTEPEKKAVLLKLENNIIMRNVRKDIKMSEFITDEIMKDLSKDEIKVIRFLYPSKNINVKLTNEILGKKDSYSRRVLKGLASKKIIFWHGSNANDPTQYYSLYEE
ncbi:hypothetical protein BHM04_10520 [Macrococcus sp. IME1552]|nr:hypothetical protein BHM04_10520 [Macrococcus sp. IME1552]